MMRVTGADCTKQCVANQRTVLTNVHPNFHLQSQTIVNSSSTNSY